MNHASITRMYEEATDDERHQFLAGADRVIKLEDNRLRKCMAVGQQKTELGIEQGDEHEPERE